jgi:lipopolysaccharide export system permease protein
MDRYLLAQFWTSFFPLFSALFVIASVVSFVQLSAMTAVVKITMSELFWLYVLQLPRLILYTLPVTFFAALITSFSRLSVDLETIAIFSLKSGVLRVARPFAPIALILSLTLLYIGFVLAPQTQSMLRHFVYGKKDDALINIRTGEFGQKFGDWMIFAGEKSGENIYKEIALYNRNADKSGFLIMAEKAEVLNDEGVLRLVLIGGRSFEIKDGDIAQMDFAKMRLNEAGGVKNIEFKGVAEYWAEFMDNPSRRREFIWAFMAGIFTIVCLPAAAIGIHSPRFTKNRAGLWALVLAMLFYIPAMTLGDKLGLYVFLVPPIWIVGTYLLAASKLKRF